MIISPRISPNIMTVKYDDYADEYEYEDYDGEYEDDVYDYGDEYEDDVYDWDYAE